MTSPPIAVVPYGVPMRTQRWGLWDVVITLALAYALTIGVSFVGAYTGLSLETALLLSAFATFVGFGAWPIIATVWRGNGPRLDLGLTFQWRNVGIGIIGGFIGLLLIGIAAWLTYLIVGDFNSTIGEFATGLIATSGVITWVTLGLMIIVAAPIAEELAFRGLLFSALLKRGVPPWLVVVITAAAFALVHIEPVRIGLIFIAGILLGVIRMRTGSLTAPIVAHMVINAPAGLFVMFGMPELPGMTP